MKKIINGGILNGLLTFFFLLSIILLSVVFILKLYNHQNGNYKYVETNGNKGRAKRCYTEIINEPPTSKGKIKCELKDGAIIEVEKYEIIGGSK